MKIRELFKKQSKIFSFEFFLPKTAEDTEHFFDTLEKLKKLNPSFVSLTYGAGGGAEDKTVEMAGAIKNRFGFETMMHLTCITHTRHEIEMILGEVKRLGIENILALRGDIPRDDNTCMLAKPDYRHASELVEHIRRSGDFSIAVAGHPEGHPEARSPEEDIKYLKEKVGKKADFVITQLFFDNKFYFDFIERARSAQITVPIIPGIMPITNVEQLKRFATMCGASIPEQLLKSLEAVKDNGDTVMEIGVRHAISQCEELLSRGAPGIHFYTLNKSLSTQVILKSLKKKFSNAG